MTLIIKTDDGNQLYFKYVNFVKQKSHFEKNSKWLFIG